MPEYDPALHAVTLTAPFALGELLESLVLYERVHLHVDDDLQLLEVINWFGPQNFVSFFEEFHETTVIHALSQTVLSGPGNSTQIGFLDSITGYQTNLEYMRQRKVVLSKEAGSPSMLTDSMKNDPRAEAVLRRIKWADWVPDNFFPSLFNDPRELSRRLKAYADAAGIPVPPAFTVRVGEYSDWHYSDVVGETDDGTKFTGAKRILDQYVAERIATFGSPTIEPSANLILPGNAPFLLSYDMWRLLDPHTNARETQTLFRDALTATVPNLALATQGLERMPDELFLLLAKARRSRLSLEPEVRLRDVITATLRPAWLERLPPRIARWTLFEGIGEGIGQLNGGSPGFVAAAAISAFDAFLLDKLATRWSPNQYLVGYRDSVERLARGAALARGADA